MYYELFIYMSDLFPLGCKKLCRDPVYPPTVCSTLLNHSALFNQEIKSNSVDHILSVFHHFLCVCTSFIF